MSMSCTWCVAEAFAGGTCQSGAASAAFAKLGTPLIAEVGSTAGQVVAAAVMGGLGSVAGGGKFENGVVTGAFGYLFNQLASRGCVFTCTTTVEGMRQGQTLGEATNAGALFRDVTAPALVGSFGAAATVEWGGLAALGAAVLSAGFMAWYHTGAQADRSWRALSFSDKWFYEIGQKYTVNYLKYAHLDPVARGSMIVETQGLIRAVVPERAGFAALAPNMLATGPTPLFR